MSKPIVLVSACLAGQKVRYDGRACLCTELGVEGDVHQIAFCPEMAAGLPVPRPPAEIQGGDGAAVLASKARVIDFQGTDVTEFFVRGAEQALAVAQQHQVKVAILKQNSPSCGCGRIYEGDFSGNLKNGDGVTAALLRQHGIKVVSR
ncbi:DUF523 domain-containing protein [Snodgrassella sp. CFCC 13594]|uniref:DUF523 domain-containing protein n=1 Tax=Snodgrassella sp. CFCC 13594 TaxID=1775559 RepID=UPI000A8CE305|nr:DUF523 domain-containing protein [Snodgrassella sp. CFCC 13594]